MPSRFAVGFLLIILACPVFAASTPPITGTAFQQRITSDVKSFSLLRANLQQTVDFARTRPALFKPTKAEKVVSLPEEFSARWQRPNWHILIQDAPLEAKRL